MRHLKKGRHIMTISEKEKIIAECEKNAVPYDKIDFSDIPEITDFSNFKPAHSEYFKPKREQISIRLSKYIVDHFKAMGKGWQTKINDFLAEAVQNGQI